MTDVTVVVVAEAGDDVAHAREQRVSPVENVSSKRQSVAFGGAEGPPKAWEKRAASAVLIQAVERYLRPRASRRPVVGGGESTRKVTHEAAKKREQPSRNFGTNMSPTSRAPRTRNKEQT